MTVWTIPGCGRFHAATARDAEMADRAAAFVDREPLAFDRNPATGHVTGSGFVVSPCRVHTCLIHHAKLDRWLQPGGHCDGLRDAAATAAREVVEETGLVAARLVSPYVFDIDIHEIPARGDDPAHLHYDMRYLFEVPQGAVLEADDDSVGLAWVPLARLERWTEAPSVLILRDKLGWRTWR